MHMDISLRTNHYSWRQWQWHSLSGAQEHGSVNKPSPYFVVSLLLKVQFINSSAICPRCLNPAFQVWRIRGKNLILPVCSDVPAREIIACMSVLSCRKSKFLSWYVAEIQGNKCWWNSAWLNMAVIHSSSVGFKISWEYLLEYVTEVSPFPCIALLTTEMLSELNALVR